MNLTPKEIEWALAAFSENCRREAERTELLAWLAGGYAALGVRAPDRYPRKPYAAPPREMTDEEMKRAFLNLADGAERRREE